MILPRHLLIFP